MSAFTVPGLTLEQVLEACKQPDGKRLYGELVDAARKLVAFVETGEPTREKKRTAAHKTAHAQATDRRVLGVLRRLGGWVAPRDLAEAAGVSQQPLKNALARLLERGQVEAQGNTRSRRYRAVDAGPVAPAKRDPALARAEAANGAGTVQGRVLLACRYQPCTVRELAAKLTLPPADVDRAVAALEDEGEIARAGRRRGAVVYRAQITA